MLTRFAYQLLDQLEAAAGSDESGADATADQIRGEDAAPRDASIGSGHQSMLPGFQNNAAAHGASQSAAAPLDPAPCCSPAVAQAEAASPLMPSPGHVHGACGHMPVRTPCDLDTDDTAVQVTVSMQPAISPQLTTAEQKPSSSAAVGLSAPTDSGSKSVWVPARQLKTTWAEYVGSDEDSGDDAEEASGDEVSIMHVVLMM